MLKSLIVIAALVFTSSSSWAQDKTFELRGFKLGMSEREVLQNIEKLDANKKNVHAICEGSTKTTSAELDRVCVVFIGMMDQDWITTFKFFNDKLGSADFKYKKESGKEMAASAVSNALKVKFGKPFIEKSTQTTWIRKGQVLNVDGHGDSIVILLFANTYIDESQRRVGVAAKKNAEKL